MARLGYLDRTLNLRAGPSTNHALRAEIGKGRRVEVREIQGDWAMVRVENGPDEGLVGFLWRHDVTMDR